MGIQRRTVLAAIAASSAAGLSGCLGVLDDAEEPAVVGETLTLTTTTSTYDTGLLDEVNAPFEDRFGVTVDAVAQGTGQALETARNGDADVVLVHARSLEDGFLRAGYGINRRNLMYNDFVIVGPEDDPAGVADREAPEEALTAIAEAAAPFISRGDESGTHTKELELWEAAGADPGGGWYQETGSGMGEALTIADEQAGYTLSDRGTFLDQRAERDLVILMQGPIEGGPEILANPYGVIAVNPGVHEDANYDLAMAYIGFLTGPEGQQRIEEFESNGEQLFFPEALAGDPRFEQYVPTDWRSDPE
ncbi:MAG: substrate-binding domain-containing protein [Halobacteriota archaeon]